MSVTVGGVFQNYGNIPRVGPPGAQDIACSKRASVFVVRRCISFSVSLLVSMLLSSCFLNLLCYFLLLLDVYLGSPSMSTACQISIRYHSEAYHPPFRASPASPLDIIGERLHSIVPS